MYEKHLFICTNVRAEGVGPTPGCGAGGGLEILAYLKQRVKELGLNKKIRINGAGCLGKCEMEGVCVLYPRAIWLHKITTREQAERLLSEILLADSPQPEGMFTLADVLARKGRGGPKNGG